MLQISLRQLFILVAAIALAIVSLNHASFAWQSVIGLLAMVALLTAVVVAIVDRGSQQAFAIGCAVVMLGYALLVMNGKKVVRGGNDPRNIELDVVGAKPALPTTALLQLLYYHVYSVRYIDNSTGRDVPNMDANKYAAAETVGATFGMHTMNWPPSGSFAVIGHYWWGLLFGFLGGHIARFVYMRRTKEQATQAHG